LGEKDANGIFLNYLFLVMAAKFGWWLGVI